MGKFATGKNAIAISDRSGMQFPYSEMVREWNGSWVHISEYEIKQPQLELKVRGGDGTALQNPRPPSGAAGTNPVPALLGLNPLFTTDAGSGIINVFSFNHGRLPGEVVRFRGAPKQSPGTGSDSDPIGAFSNIPNVDGILGSVICQEGGNIINLGFYQNGAVVPKTDNNWFYFTAASGSATEGNKQGGGTIVTAGPLVLLP